MEASEAVRCWPGSAQPLLAFGQAGKASTAADPPEEGCLDDDCTHAHLGATAVVIQAAELRHVARKQFLAVGAAALCTSEQQGGSADKATKVVADPAQGWSQASGCWEGQLPESPISADQVSDGESTDC